MTSKQSAKVQKLINKAMLAIQDAQEALRITDTEATNEDARINYKRTAAHSDLANAMSNLHWALGNTEEATL